MLGTLVLSFGSAWGQMRSETTQGLALWLRFRIHGLGLRARAYSTCMRQGVIVGFGFGVSKYWAPSDHWRGFREFRVSGFRVLGFRVLGFRV